MPDERPPAAPSSRGPAVGLQIMLPFASAEELRARCGAELARGTLFIRTRKPRPQGTRIRFEVRLGAGERALYGLATVAESFTDPDPNGRNGMLLQFQALDEDSHALLRSFGWPQRLPVVQREASAGGAAAASVATSNLPPPRPPVGPPPAPAGVRSASQAPGRGLGTPPARPPSGPAPAAEPPPEPPEDRPLPVGRAPAHVPPVVAPAPVAPAAPVPAGLAPPTVEGQIESIPELARTAGTVEAGRPEGGAGEEAEKAPRAPRKGPVVGIDLGTTNSLVAWVHHGKPGVIPSREGHNTIPSVLAVNERGKILVGHPAKGQLLTNPRNTVYGAKRLMGRPFHSPALAQLKARFPYEIVEGPRGEAAVKAGGLVFTLQEIAAHILREVREVARAKLGQDVSRAVITVPAWYTDHQRNAVREAGDLAGIFVEQIVNEPTAAALAFGHGRQLQERVLIYDLGGGTFDVSVLELAGNIYKVVSTGGDIFLGGIDFDLRVMGLLLERYAQWHGRPFAGDPVAQQRVLDAAERAKIALSEAKEYRVLVPFLESIDGRPANLDVLLGRPELEQATGALVDRTLQVTAEVLASRGLRPTDIDEVLLVGGQSRMPLVREKLRAFFGKDPHKGVHPDEAVALGAALLADAVAADRPNSLVLVDVLPTSIGIGSASGRFVRIIPRNTPLPHVKTHTHATTRDNQTSLDIAIFQGESERAMENEYLGSVKIEHLPRAPRGAVKVDVTFKLTKEALLTVTVREGSTGAARVVTLTTRDTPEKVRQMLEDTEEKVEETGFLAWLKGLFRRERRREQV